MSLDVWLALVALFGIGGLTPGPAVMLVLGSSFRYGFKRSMLAALGIASANVIWLVLAASGAAALALQFPNAFFMLKIIGVLVIMYLAASTIFGPLPDVESSVHTNVDKVTKPPSKPFDTKTTWAGLYAKGVALQISSPLPLVYFGLLLPAYFVPSEPLAAQFLIMLVTVTVTELFGLAAYAYGAARVRQWMRHPKAARLFNIIIGVIMILSGLWAVVSTIDV